MRYLVEFEQHGARIIKDPIEMESKKGLDNVLLDPDLTHLRGVSPSFWIKRGNEITIASEVERGSILEVNAERVKEIEALNQAKFRDQIFSEYKSVMKEDHDALQQKLISDLENFKKEFKLYSDSCNNEIKEQLSQAKADAKKHAAILYVAVFLSVAACIALRLL